MSEYPPNCLVYTEHTITGVLRSFYISDYFTGGYYMATRVSSGQASI
jgi:hypothetical protein